MTSALITAAVLLIVGGLIALAVRLSGQRGGLRVEKETAQAADEARKVRDEVEQETYMLDDAALAARLSKWLRRDGGADGMRLGAADLEQPPGSTDPADGGADRRSQ